LKKFKFSNFWTFAEAGFAILGDKTPKLFLSAFVSGILLTLAYPKFNFWPVATVAIVPYFCCLITDARNKSWRQVFLSAFVLGSVWYLSSIWWIAYVTFWGMLALSLFIASILAFYITLGWFFY